MPEADKAKIREKIQILRRKRAEAAAKADLSGSNGGAEPRGADEDPLRRILAESRRSGGQDRGPGGDSPASGRLLELLRNARGGPAGAGGRRLRRLLSSGGEVDGGELNAFPRLKRLIEGRGGPGGPGLRAGMAAGAGAARLKQVLERRVDRLQKVLARLDERERMAQGESRPAADPAKAGPHKAATSSSKQTAKKTARAASAPRKRRSTTPGAKQK